MNAIKLKTIATCDCLTGHHEQTEVVFSESAEGYICLYCHHFPVWTKNVIEAAAATSSVTWRQTFSADLNDLLENWGTNVDDDYDTFGNFRNLGADRE
jgi:hypothetical protein